MIRAAAWKMRDGRNGAMLNINLLLIGNYFTIATDWDDDKGNLNWYTRRFDTTEEAHGYAVHHTGALESAGDTLTHGPLVAKVADPGEHLDELVDRDRPSYLLDLIFSQIMVAGSEA